MEPAARMGSDLGESDPANAVGDVHTTGEPPDISVVLIAHREAGYLSEALDSLAAQSLDRSRYEVVLVKNFRDESIDRRCAATGIRNLYTDAESGAAKIARGLRASQGDIVTFLDYDDVYDPTRLAVLEKEFDANPRLGFYRNGLYFLDSAGRAISPGDLRWSFRVLEHDGRRIRVPNSEKAHTSPRFDLGRPELNIGTMAVRRPVVDLALPYVDRLVMSVDSLLFYAAWCSSYDVLVDAPQLTGYRLHGSNSTSGNWFAEARNADFAIIRELVARAGTKGVEDELRAQSYYDQVLQTLRQGTSRRRDVWELADRFGRELRSVAPLRFRASVGLMLGVGLASPWLARAAMTIYA